MRLTFSLAIILCSFSGLQAQESKQYSFKQFTTATGLASNAVNCILQDRDGFIWMATVNGLQRYDGNSFLTFKTNGNNRVALPTNNIRELYEDRKGQLWLVTVNNEIGFFDTRKFLYHPIEIPEEKRRFYLNQKFLELPSGELLLIKQEGTVLRYVESQQRFVSDPDIIPAPPNWRRNEARYDAKTNSYWMAGDSGLARYNLATHHLNYRRHNVDNDPVIEAVGDLVSAQQLFVTSNSDIIFSYWLAKVSRPTIYRYNRKLNKAESFDSGFVGYHEIISFLEQQNGRLWIYGMPFFAEWTDEKPSLKFIPNEYRNERSIKFDYPNRAIEDREHNIWIATDNGVYVFNPDGQIFNTYNMVRPNDKPIEANVQAVVQLNNGNMLVGTWGPGLFYFDKNYKALPLPRGLEPYRNYTVWDMEINPKTDELWITLQSGGLVVYNQKTGVGRVEFPEVFGGSTIRQIDNDTSGNFWFGTQSGKVVRWDYKASHNNPKTGYELVYQTNMVFKVHYEYAGYIYVGAFGEGLIKIDAKTKKLVKRFTSRGRKGERLFMDSPADMTYYDDSTMIIAAGCINILNTKTDKISFITEDDGLPSNTAQSIERDHSGTVWLGMTNGICRVNLQKKLISYYDRQDGIIYDKFAQAGAKELTNEHLIFFTDHNIVVFDPRKFGQKDFPPKVYITSFRLGGEPLSVDSLMAGNRTVLKYNNTSIAINFNALSYSPQQKIHYYYMMEGIDKDWIRTDRPDEVVYNFLPPGRYNFLVKSENADGISNNYVASLPIVVRPPVWQTWWFYSLIGLMVIGILYLLDRERMNKIRSLQLLRRQIRLSLTDEVSTTLNNINVLSEIAKIKADKNIDQAKDFIDQISDKSRYMIEAMDDSLWSIDPANDSMKHTVLRIKEYTDGVRTSTSNEIDLIVDRKVQTLELDMKLRLELFSFYKAALTFIVEQVACEQIFVNINQVKGKLLLEILAECNNRLSDFEFRFNTAVEKRLKALPATMDILADNKSFSVLLYVEVK